jgi:hypothetical protein
VRQGSEVVHGEPFCIEPRREQAVLYASTDGDCREAGVEGHLIEMRDERHLIAGRVGDVVEGVPRAEGLERRMRFDDLHYVFDRCRLIELLCGVSEVAGPVCSGFCVHRACAVCDSGKEAFCKDDSGSLEELSFVHRCSPAK